MFNVQMNNNIICVVLDYEISLQIEVYRNIIYNNILHNNNILLCVIKINAILNSKSNFNRVYARPEPEKVLGL